MATVFAITTANDTLKLDPGKQGEALFTITNSTSRPLRGLAKLKPLGNTKQEWLKLAGESERDFPAGGTQQFAVGIEPPANTPPGTYSFRLDVVSTLNPDEDFTEGPTVTAEVLPPKPPPPSKAWMIPVALIVVLLVVGAIVWFASRPKQVAVPSPPPGKPVVRIVTLGAKDHGKTTLTSAITKVLSQTGGAKFVYYDEIENPPETKVQGIMLAAVQVEYETAKAHYIQIDCYNHADYVKLLTSDGVILDGAIVVVSVGEEGARESDKQIREQLLLAQQKGIKSIIVYINKIDLLGIDDPEKLSELKPELKPAILGELLKRGFKEENVTFISGSALMALVGKNDKIGKDSIVELLKAMDRLFAK